MAGRQRNAGTDIKQKRWMKIPRMGAPGTLEHALGLGSPGPRGTQSSFKGSLQSGAAKSFPIRHPHGLNPGRANALGHSASHRSLGDRGVTTPRSGLGVHGTQLGRCFQQSANQAPRATQRPGSHSARGGPQNSVQVHPKFAASLARLRGPNPRGYLGGGPGGV